jgi:DNA-binding CsgD family transcriptional regulator
VPSRPIIGRAEELAAAERFLDALDDGSAVLVFEGEPGIGKTTLLRAGVETARRRGVRVLSCVASTSESRLAYAALADLFATVEQDTIERLPEPQREALDAALLRSGTAAANVDRRAVSTAVLSVLGELTSDGRLVVAIDDLQWLDGPTARVIEFCARRLARGTGVIAARRLGEDGQLTGDAAKLNDAHRIEVRRVAPLAPDAVHRMVRERLPDPLDRWTIERVQEASGGNPFFALELARALPEKNPPGPALPLPANLEEIVGARIAGLGLEVEDVLLAVAVLADPTVDLLERALGPGALERLEEAEARGMIEVEGRRVRFAHPLLAAGVYGRAPELRRRAMHRRLGEVVDSIEERARHLAFADTGPAVIEALDEAARSVRARGAPDSAAELLELALERGGGHELRVRAAEYHFDAGNARRARVLLGEAIPELDPGEARAEALLLLAEVRYRDDSFREGLVLLEQARAEPDVGIRVRAMIDLRLAFVKFHLGPPQGAAGPARSALDGAEELGDPGLHSFAMASVLFVDFCVGLGLDEERLARALELEDPDLRIGGDFLPTLLAFFLYLWTGRFDEARAMLASATARYADRGEEHALAWALFHGLWLECWSGNVAAATEGVDDVEERLLALGTPNARALALATRAQVDAYAGRVDEARNAAEEALAMFEDARWRWAWWPLMTLGFIDLSVGDVEAAARRLGPVAGFIAQYGLAEPTAGGALISGDVSEALIAAGRLDDAEPVVTLLEERGAALDRAWAIAVGARCRGLMLAAQGDVAGAERALDRALEAHERLPMPLERARSLLVLGRIRRRRRKRRAAKEALDEAKAIFERAGSPRWAERAEAEIAAIGLRPTTSDGLTASEERVAALAASGLTNQQVADALIVSPKTVEAHLARAYRKLGIRSRAELGARMAQRDGGQEEGTR